MTTRRYYVQIAAYVDAENTTHALSIAMEKLDTVFEQYEVFDGNVVEGPEVWKDWSFEVEEVRNGPRTP